jgi:hypothetical protein
MDSEDHPGLVGSPIIRDPQEDDPRLREIFKQVDTEVEKVLSTYSKESSSIHIYWGTKQRILKEKYGIDWNTPAEMNPSIYFD